MCALQLVHDDKGVDMTVFFRLDRGIQKVDHHIFFLYEGPQWHVHHTSYETHDFDTQVLGHDWLRHQGYKNCWGVGRHVMGSQIFDYWYVSWLELSLASADLLTLGAGLTQPGLSWNTTWMGTC